MKYEVKMSCGHTETIQLFGKTADRERKIEWLERYGLCEECKKEQVAKEIKKAEEAGLPELEGSEKQIAWAAKIRNGFMPKAKEALERNSKAPCDEMEEEIDDQDAIEDMKEQCGNTDLEDSIRQYKYLLEEYIENKKGE